jgi:prephenate dehydratase
MEKKYAIQGFEGSFHEEAAQTYFKNEVDVICCHNFRETFAQATQNKNCSGAVVAIENSIAGSILPNYTLLQKSKLQIVGEIYLKIKQQLIVNPFVELKDIKEVHSHPMALLQCLDYLEKFNWKLVETEDTALSAKYIKQHHCKHIAAIAGNLAAEQNQLKIITPNIHTEKNNITRFLILDKNANQDIITANKASIYFQTQHTQGSLVKVLNIIAKKKLNLSKLQSFPVAGSNFKYYFHADVEFDNLKHFEAIQKELIATTVDYKVYGIYEKGKIK